MKKISLPIVLSFLACSFLANASTPLPGRWVRVAVQETGIYSISYDELKAHGFEHPEMVGVFGRGGRMMPEQIEKGNGLPITRDPMEQIAVLHSGEHIYFYGLGVEEIGFEVDPNIGIGGKFNRQSLNVYSDKGYYLLCETEEPLTVKTTQLAEDSTYTTPELCLDYSYFEEDKVHNGTSSGRLFWGDEFSTATKKRSYTLREADKADKSHKGYARVEFHYANAEESKLYVDLGGGESLMRSMPKVETYNYQPLGNVFGELWFPGSKPVMTLTFDPKTASSVGYLDWYIVSFARPLPTESEAAQSRFALVNPAAKNTLLFPECAAEVWDVTDPFLPVRAAQQEADMVLTSNTLAGQYVMFSPASRQKQVEWMAEVSPLDFSEEIAAGAELLIITTDDFRSEAEELAELHRQGDGINVLVSTANELYDSFTASLPDPMAYKRLAYRLYKNQERQLQNILLFGPITSDLRAIRATTEQPQRIIGYQNTNVSRTAGAANANDFYGMLKPYEDSANWLREMSVGVGVLPVASQREAQIAIEKTRKTMALTHGSYLCNSLLGVTSPGDNHMSDAAGIEMVTRLQGYSGGNWVPTLVVADAFKTSDLARERWLQALQRGSLFNIYCGHGDPTAFAASYRLLTPADAMTINNERLPFAFFAGCSLTNFDRGNGGIGEQIILGMESGFAGAVIASRETYSNENIKMSDEFFKSIFFDIKDEKRPSQATVGRIYADMKNRLNLSNELNYQLMCDPALRFPFPIADMEIQAPETAKSGETITLSGTLADNFNGEATLRLLSPAREQRSGNYLSKDEIDAFYITYEDETLVMATVPVKDGKFSASMQMPPVSYDLDDAVLAVCAYSADDCLSAAKKAKIDIKRGKVENNDTQAPVITLSYSLEENCLEAKITDNQQVSIGTAPFSGAPTVYLDGRTLPGLDGALQEVDADGKSASFRFSLPSLDDSTYAISMTASDMAGNQGYASLSIVSGLDACSPKISMEGHADSQSVTLQLVGVPAVLVIANENGEVVLRKAVKEEVFSWDFKDSSGKRVPAGLYSAWLLDGDETRRPGSSPRLPIPVISLQ